MIKTRKTRKSNKAQAKIAISLDDVLQSIKIAHLINNIASQITTSPLDALIALVEQVERMIDEAVLTDNVRRALYADLLTTSKACYICKVEYA